MGNEKRYTLVGTIIAAFALIGYGMEARAQDAATDAPEAGEPSSPPTGHDVAIQPRAISVRSVVRDALARDLTLRFLPYTDQAERAQLEIINRGTTPVSLDEVEIHTQRVGTTDPGPSGRWERGRGVDGGDFEITVPEALTAGRRGWITVSLAGHAPRSPGHFVGDVTVRLHDQFVVTRIPFDVLVRNGVVGALLAFFLGALFGKGAAYWKLTPSAVKGFKANSWAFVTGDAEGSPLKAALVVTLFLVVAAIEFNALYVTKGMTFGEQRWAEYLALIVAGITLGASQHLTTTPKAT